MTRKKQPALDSRENDRRIRRMIEILTMEKERPDPAALARAKEVLRAGGLVIVPTETVYGIACDPALPAADSDA